MECPTCHSDTKVKDSRQRHNMIYRRRECPECGLFSTFEVPANIFPPAGDQNNLQVERDRAIGALGVLVHDGVISEMRMRELMGERAGDERCQQITEICNTGVLNGDSQ